MFEPLTLTLAELAARWRLTARQVLQHAQQPGVPLYFAFEGLVFDIGDQWHRHGGDWREAERRDALTKSVENGEAWLLRRRDGQLTEWDQLSQEEAVKLRGEIEASKTEIRNLSEVLAARDAERCNRHFRGFLRAAPSTLWDIESIGAAPFPHKAFHPSSPVTVVRLPDVPAGEGGWIWDGRLVSLEPMHENDRHWKKQLTADDLVAITNEVKAIEAKSLPSNDDPIISDKGDNQAIEAASLGMAEPRSDADELGISKRERQIRTILSTIRALGYEPMNIPDRGKKTLMEKCKQSRPDLFGGGDDPFIDAWREGLKQKRLRMENHHRFIRR